MRETRILKAPKFLRWISFFVLISCASYTEQTAGIHSSFVASRYDEALEKLESSEVKEQDRNRLLFNLEKAIILDRLGQSKASRKLLSESSKIADELYTKSITKEVATYLVSEDKSEYAGEDYEKVAIHTLLALSYLEEGQLGEARVEARKINNKIAELNKGYEESPNKYSDDGFAWLLSAAIYEAKEEWDDAIIDYDKALKSYRGAFANFSDGVPEALVIGYANSATIRNRQDRLKELSQSFPKVFKKYTFPLKGKSTLFVSESGVTARKQSESFFLPVGDQIIRYSWPIIKNISPSYPPQVRASNSTLTFDRAISFSNIAKETLENKRTRYTLKSMARLIAKSKLTQQAEKNFGPLGGLLANIFVASTETADTRSWTLLPESIHLCRVQSDRELESFSLNQETRKINPTKGKIDFVVIK